MPKELKIVLTEGRREVDVYVDDEKIGFIQALFVSRSGEGSFARSVTFQFPTEEVLEKLPVETRDLINRYKNLVDPFTGSPT